MVFATLNKINKENGPEEITRDDMIIPETVIQDAKIDFGQKFEHYFGSNISNIIDMIESMKDSVSEIILKYMTLSLLFFLTVSCAYFLYKYVRSTDRLVTASPTNPSFNSLLVQRTEDL